MFTFGAWKPWISVEYGDQQLSAALHSLASYGPELDQPRRDQARSLVDYANDIKHTLNNKHLLTRIKPARLYARKASEALQTIKLCRFFGLYPKTPLTDRLVGDTQRRRWKQKFGFAEGVEVAGEHPRHTDGAPELNLCVDLAIRACLCVWRWSNGEDRAHNAARQ